MAECFEGLVANSSYGVKGQEHKLNRGAGQRNGQCSLCSFSLQRGLPVVVPPLNGRGQTLPLVSLDNCDVKGSAYVGSQTGRTFRDGARLAYHR